MRFLNTTAEREVRVLAAFMLEALVLSFLSAPPHLAGVAILVGCVLALPLALVLSTVLYRKNLLVLFAISGIVDLAWLAGVQLGYWKFNPIALVLLKVLSWIALAYFAPNARATLHDKGLCPACGYPIGASPVCTECGAAVNRIAR